MCCDWLNNIYLFWSYASCDKPSDLQDIQGSYEILHQKLLTGENLLLSVKESIGEVIMQEKFKALLHTFYFSKMILDKYDF